MGEQPSRALVAARYDAGAERYDELWSRVILPVAEELVARLDLAGARRVLDAGAVQTRSRQRSTRPHAAELLALDRRTAALVELRARLAALAPEDFDAAGTLVLATGRA